MARLLVALHVVALVLWVVAFAAGQVIVLRGRRRDPRRELLALRRSRKLVLLEHAALALAFATGLALMAVSGLRLGRFRWLDLKLGLVAFLVLPLEAFHAYVNHVWIARGLAQAPSPPLSRDLARGASMDEMVRMLALPLLGASVPLLWWLSLARPF